MCWGYVTITASKRPRTKWRPTESPERFSHGRLRACAILLLMLLAPLIGAQPVPSQPEDADTAITMEAPISEPPDRLVIIIDDLGHQLSNGRQAADLPGAITLSILPYTGHGDRIAKRGFKAGKEIMLHAPMSNLANQPIGAGGLTPELSEEEFRATLTASLQQIPHVQGVNNHMGSELTQYRLQMGWLMDELKARALYFVDSRTSSDTVAASVAQEYALPHLSRQVFLDNEATREAIEERFNAAVSRAKKDGLAVAIGHPYKATLDFLAEALPALSEQNIELVTVSAALPAVQPVAEPQNPEIESVPETALAAEAAADQNLTSTPLSAM